MIFISMSRKSESALFIIAIWIYPWWCHNVTRQVWGWCISWRSSYLYSYGCLIARIHEAGFLSEKNNCGIVTQVSLTIIRSKEGYLILISKFMLQCSGNDWLFLLRGLLNFEIIYDGSGTWCWSERTCSRCGFPGSYLSCVRFRIPQGLWACAPWVSQLFNLVATLFLGTLTPYEEVRLVSKLPQFIHLKLKNLFFTLLDI